MWIVLLMEETEYQDKTTDLQKVNDILTDKFYKLKLIYTVEPV